MSKYRSVHPSKESQAAKAARDYEEGNYDNKNAVGSRGYEDYHAAYYDLVLQEDIGEEE